MTSISSSSQSEHVLRMANEDPLNLPEGLSENLRFLILEVTQQVERTREYCLDRSERLRGTILARDDYIDNLKTLIHRKCFLSASKIPTGDRTRLDLIKAIEVITINLERIADFCANIITQFRYIENEMACESYETTPPLDVVIQALGKIEQAVFRSSSQLGLEICRAEPELDRLWLKAYRSLLNDLSHGQDTQTFVTLIFIFRYTERMGDSLLNIGEAILSASLGERIKIEQFEALGEMGDTDEAVLEAVGETRSGCRINRVESIDGDHERNMIFKEGRASKVRAEREGIETWNRLYPGIVPKIYAFHEEGDQASILIEFLDGRTFEDILVNGDDLILERSRTAIARNLSKIWTETREETSVPAQFMKQVETRLPQTYAVHPEFLAGNERVGPFRVKSMETLVARALDMEEQWKAPYSVLVHGDFNVDNVIYSERDNRIHFIDVHRSRRMDWVQDLSVFLISNRRFQSFDPAVRERIDSTMKWFCEFGREFAQESGDTTFEHRLGLGLARSYITSTRFILNKDFARSLFLRGKYLLEKILNHRNGDFRVPLDALLD